MQPKPKPQPANVKTFHVELSAWQTAGADGKVKAPSEFRIFKAGINESVKGIWKFSAASAERVMEKAKAYANEFSIDYGHGMFSMFSADPAQAGKAAGWFRPEVRSGELWATSVSWTPLATSFLENREYRYISPAFETDEAGEVHSLRNVALTNVPAIHDLEPLVASRDGAAAYPEEQKDERTPMKSLLILLGLADTASEAEALAALQRLQAPTLELLSMTGKPAVPEAITVVKAWKVAADSVPAMHAELSQLKQREVDTERSALIAEGKRTGRIPPAYEPVMKTWETSQIKDFLKVAVPVMQQNPPKEGGGSPTTVTLSQEEVAVARAMNLDPVLMAKAKQLRAGVVPTAPATSSDA